MRKTRLLARNRWPPGQQEKVVKKWARRVSHCDLMEKDATEQCLTKAKTNKGCQRLPPPFPGFPPPPLFSTAATGSDARRKRQGVPPPEVWTARTKKFAVITLCFTFRKGQRQGISLVVVVIYRKQYLRSTPSTVPSVQLIPCPGKELLKVSISAFTYGE
jgi:hypothetical protein